MQRTEQPAINSAELTVFGRFEKKMRWLLAPGILNYPGVFSIGFMISTSSPFLTAV